MKEELGNGVVGTLAAFAAVGSTLLMLHFLRRLISIEATGPKAPAGLLRSWLTIALASVVVPWTLYPLTQSGARAAALETGELWAALWPVLLGGVLAIGLWRSGRRLPQVPEGDIVVVSERAVRATVVFGEAIERADDWLRQWPVASLSLLSIAILLAVALMAAR